MTALFGISENSLFFVNWDFSFLLSHINVRYTLSYIAKLFIIFIHTFFCVISSVWWILNCRLRPAFCWCLEYIYIKKDVLANICLDFLRLSVFFWPKRTRLDSSYFNRTFTSIFLVTFCTVCIYLGVINWMHNTPHVANFRQVVV